MTSVQRDRYEVDDESNPEHHQRRTRSRLSNKPTQSKLQLRHLLSDLGPDAADPLWNSLVELVIKAVLLAQPHLYQSYQLCRVGKNATPVDGRKRKEESVCFEILGFDIIIDRTLRPFLLEVLVTSAKDVMSCPAFVCLSVCLSVSNFTLKTTERIFTKILPQMYLCTRKNWLNCGTYPLLGPNSQTILR